nr:MAG TPA: hypothetical protein [Caudoviricetes sp.]
MRFTCFETVHSVCRLRLVAVGGCKEKLGEDGVIKTC